LLNSEPDAQLDRVYKSLIVLALLVALLVFNKDIVVPMAFAGLFSVVLLPIETRIERSRPGFFDPPVLLGSFVFFGLIPGSSFRQLTSLVASLPDIEQHLRPSLMK